MSTTLGIVEVWSPSLVVGGGGAGLAGRRLGGKPLLEWIVRRVTDSLLLDRVIVATDAGRQDAVFQLTPSDVTVFASTQEDSLGRLAAAAREFDANQLVRVTIDNPFVDPVLIDRLICTANAHPGCDYIGYYSNDGQPAVMSRLGVFAEWCRAAAIFRADNESSDAAERQEATRYVYSHPELFQLRLIPVPVQLDRSDVRLTIDVEDDWDHAQTIVEALGPENLDWQGIARLLKQHPEMRRRMALLNKTTAK